MHIPIRKSSFCYLLIGVIVFPIFFLGSPTVSLITMISFAIMSYMAFRPKHFFSPLNVIFAFFFLYAIAPATVSFLYQYAVLDQSLPGTDAYNWFNLDDATLRHIFLSFFFFFYFGIAFTRDDIPNRNFARLQKEYVYILSVLTLLLLFAWIELTGGLHRWIFYPKETHLLGRAGLGQLNLVTFFFVDLAVFSLGLVAFQSKGRSRLLALCMGLIIIVFAALTQGVKSRTVFLLIYLLWPYLWTVRLSLIKSLSVVLAVGVVLYFGNLFRTGGYYEGLKALEYIVHYANAYFLHDLVVGTRGSGLFETTSHLFVKPLVYLGLLDPASDFDLSVMLTKEYFPEQWHNWRATQQWPLITELYLNWHGFLLGWLPILVYMLLLSCLYFYAKRSNNLGLIFITIHEVIRMLSMFRGTLIPWQMPIYLAYYLVGYILLSIMIRRIRLYSKWQPNAATSSLLNH